MVMLRPVEVASVTSPVAPAQVMTVAVQLVMTKVPLLPPLVKPVVRMVWPTAKPSTRKDPTRRVKVLAVPSTATLGGQLVVMVREPEASFTSVVELPKVMTVAVRSVITSPRLLPEALPVLFPALVKPEATTVWPFTNPSVRKLPLARVKVLAAALTVMARVAGTADPRLKAL